MKLLRQNPSPARAGQRGFSMIEALVAMLMAGVMFTALYAGMHFGFRIIKLSRENTRATQIMIEHMEICRLYKWNDLTNVGGFLNTNPMVVPYYPPGAGVSSIMFTSRVSLTPFLSGVSYANDMRKLTVRVDWESIGDTNRSRTMSTYITRNGLQNYVW